MRKKSTTKGALAKRRVAIYTRKSTRHGLDNDYNSLEVQRESCEHYIQSQAHQGWELIPTRYDDGGRSGGNTERPAFQRLLEDIKKSLVDIIVVYRADRLSRSFADFLQLMTQLKKHNIEFVSVTQNFSTTTPTGRLSLNMLMSFAEFERDQNREDLIDKITKRKMKGMWTGGVAPYGYRIEDKKLVIVEKEAKGIRLLFNLYVEGHSASEVAARLNDDGYVGTGQVKRRASSWNKGRVIRSLKNPIYAGYIKCGDDRYDGQHEAIVQPELFSEANRRLNSKTTPKLRASSAPAYLLQGVLTCACCGSAMTSAGTKKRGKRYRYYKCVAQGKKGVESCPSKQLPADAVEQFVVQQIRRETVQGSLIESIESRVQTFASESRAKGTAEQARLALQITDLSSEGKELVSSLANGGTTSRFVEARLQEIEDAIEQADARRAQLELMESRLQELEQEGAWVREMLADFDTVWKYMTVDNQIRIIRATVEGVEVNEPENQIEVALFDLSSELELDLVAAPSQEQVPA